MVRKGIIHRDLKPENILLNSKTEGIYDIRIADFGFATIFRQRSANGIGGSLAGADLSETGHLANNALEKDIVCGTPGYIAPEALAGQGFTFKSDIFSVGSILFSVLTLKNLFSGTDYRAVMQQNKACQFADLDMRMRRCSHLAIDLTKQLLCKDPAKRPTAA